MRSCITRASRPCCLHRRVEIRSLLGAPMRHHVAESIAKCTDNQSLVETHHALRAGLAHISKRTDDRAVCPTSPNQCLVSLSETHDAKISTCGILCCPSNLTVEAEFSVLIRSDCLTDVCTFQEGRLDILVKLSSTTMQSSNVDPKSLQTLAFCIDRNYAGHQHQTRTTRFVLVYIKIEDKKRHAEHVSSHVALALPPTSPRPTPLHHSWYNMRLLCGRHPRWHPEASHAEDPQRYSVGAA